MRRVLLSSLLGLCVALACSVDRFGTAAGGPGGDAGTSGSAGVAGAGNFGGAFPDAQTGGAAGNSGFAGTAGVGGTAGTGGIPPQDSGLDAADAADAAIVKPTDYSGLLLWLRSDTGVVTNGVQVDIWKDQSGNGNDFAKTAATPPELVANGIGQKPAIHFAVKAGKAAQLGGPKLTFAAGVTVFMVYQLDSAPLGVSEFMELFDNYNYQSPTVSTFRSVLSGNDVYRTVSFGPPPDMVRADFVTDTAPHVLELDWSGATPTQLSAFHAYQDGSELLVLDSSGAGPQATGIGVYNAATNQFPFIGSLGELIVYDHELTTVERASLHDSLKLFWAIP